MRVDGEDARPAAVKHIVLASVPKNVEAGDSTRPTRSAATASRTTHQVPGLLRGPLPVGLTAVGAPDPMRILSSGCWSIALRNSGHSLRTVS